MKINIQNRLENLFSGTLLLVLCACIQAQDQSFNMDSIRTLITRQSKVQERLTHNLNHSELLAERIKLYHSETQLNASQHRKLEKLLQEAQTVQLKLDSLKQHLATISTDIEQKSQTGLMWLQERLMTSTKRNQLEHLDTTKVKQIETWLAWKAELESYQELYKPHQNFELSLQVTLEDSPELIKLKGDILADREELYHNEIKLIQKRISSLKVEMNVRRKVRDMSDELELFNENEELLARSVPVYSSEYPYNNVFYWDDASQENNVSGIDRKSTYDQVAYPLSGGTNLNGTIQYLRTPELIEDAIEKLQSQKKRLEQIADSLHISTNYFYQEAERRGREFE